MYCPFKLNQLSAKSRIVLVGCSTHKILAIINALLPKLTTVHVMIDEPTLKHVVQEVASECSRPSFLFYQENQLARESVCTASDFLVIQNQRLLNNCEYTNGLINRNTSRFNPLGSLLIVDSINDLSINLLEQATTRFDYWILQAGFDSPLLSTYITNKMDVSLVRSQFDDCLIMDMQHKRVYRLDNHKDASDCLVDGQKHYSTTTDAMSQQTNAQLKSPRTIVILGSSDEQLSKQVDHIYSLDKIGPQFVTIKPQDVSWDQWVSSRFKSPIQVLCCPCNLMTSDVPDRRILVNTQLVYLGSMRCLNSHDRSALLMKLWDLFYVGENRELLLDWHKGKLAPDDWLVIQSVAHKQYKFSVQKRKMDNKNNNNNNDKENKKTMSSMDNLSFDRSSVLLVALNPEDRNQMRDQWYDAVQSKYPECTWTRQLFGLDLKRPVNVKNAWSFASIDYNRKERVRLNLEEVDLLCNAHYHNLLVCMLSDLERLPCPRERRQCKFVAVHSSLLQDGSYVILTWRRMFRDKFSRLDAFQSWIDQNVQDGDWIVLDRDTNNLQMIKAQQPIVQLDQPIQDNQAVAMQQDQPVQDNQSVAMHQDQSTIDQSTIAIVQSDQTESSLAFFVNIQRTESTTVLRVPLPGVQLTNISLETSESNAGKKIRITVLQPTTDQTDQTDQQKQQQNEDEWQVPYGTRYIDLPMLTKLGQITTDWLNGVLTISCPAEQPRSFTIAVQPAVRIPSFPPPPPPPHKLPFVPDLFEDDVKQEHNWFNDEQTPLIDPNNAFESDFEHVLPTGPTSQSSSIISSNRI